MNKNVVLFNDIASCEYHFSCISTLYCSVVLLVSSAVSSVCMRIMYCLVVFLVLSTIAAVCMRTLYYLVVLIVMSTISPVCLYEYTTFFSGIDSDD